MPHLQVSAIVSEPMAATESSTRAMAALDDLYRRHVGDVYRYTYAVLGNHADAEDVLDELDHGGACRRLPPALAHEVVRDGQEPVGRLPGLLAALERA